MNEKIHHSYFTERISNEAAGICGVVGAQGQGPSVITVSTADGIFRIGGKTVSRKPDDQFPDRA